MADTRSVEALINRLKDYDDDYATRFAGKTMTDRAADTLAALLAERNALKAERDIYQKLYRDCVAMLNAARDRNHAALARAKAAEAEVARLRATVEKYRAAALGEPQP